MKATLLVVICLSLAACQSHRRQEEQNAAALLNQLNLMAAQEIAHEKNGDPPPKRFPSWQAFWQNRFMALRLSRGTPRRGHLSVQQIAAADITFIKQKRAELGLPAVE